MTSIGTGPGSRSDRSVEARVDSCARTNPDRSNRVMERLAEETSVRMIGILFLLLALRGPLLAEDDAALVTEYEAIAKGYEQALEEFFKPLQDTKGEAGVQIDWTKHPLKEWLPKALDLAERAKGKDAAVLVLVWILTHSNDRGDAPDGLHESTLKTLLDVHISSPLLERVPQAIHYDCSWTLGRTKAEEALATLVEKSPHAEVRAAALYHAAVMLTEDPALTAADRDRAKAHFERLKTEFGETRWGKLAKGYLFEIEHLQVGQKAPDFEATDVEGATFKLSDFRGKVVVVKFWGFW